MKSKSFASIIIGFLAIALLGYGFYYTMRNRPGLETTNTKSISVPGKGTSASSDEAKNSTGKTEESSNESSKKENASFEVTLEECENDCESFLSDEEKLKYCQQVCGLKKPADNDGDCNNLEKLEKDYCWKDSAVKEVNIDLCDNITDSKIKETCQNRIAEEVLE